MAVFNVWINRKNPDDPDSSNTNKVVLRESQQSVGDFVDNRFRDESVIQIIITPNRED